MAVDFSRTGANATITVRINVAQMELDKYTEMQAKEMVANGAIEELTWCIKGLPKSDSQVDVEYDDRVARTNTERNKLKQARATGTVK